MEKTYKPYPTSKVLKLDQQIKLNNLWMSTKNPAYFVWGTLQGQRIRLYNLRVSHIKNILTHLPPTYVYRQLFIDELKRREINKLKKKTAGNILYGS